jgi:hypothetical protein
LASVTVTSLGAAIFRLRERRRVHGEAIGAHGGRVDARTIEIARGRDD